MTNTSPPDDLQLIVVIPCFNEPDLIATLDSLWKCMKTKSSVEIIVVINSGEDANENILFQNEKTFAEASDWIREHQNENLKYFLMHEKNLPKKHAGVGLARKIGMDAAAGRFKVIGNNKGVIVCLDADCTVDVSYLTELENHFEKNLNTTGCSVYFEHPVDENEFDKQTCEGIVNYELFLRYYNLSIAFCGFPFPFHAIGSCMAARYDVYEKQGGMNKRKAGEDFYFLHKVFPLGNFSVLNSTRVIPSPRISDRVPFGTGSAMGKWSGNTSGKFLTYHPQTFEDLKKFFLHVPEYFQSDIKNSDQYTSPALEDFLTRYDFENNIAEIRANCASKEMFVKRFFRWFDGFLILKFAHFARDHYYGQIEIGEAVVDLLEKISLGAKRNSLSKKDLLNKLREIERKQ